MIEPVLKDEAFLEDVTRARTAEPDRLHLWWLGQSGFLVLWQGHSLLLDPYLSDSLTHKYAGTDKPHVRMTARVIAPERLDFIDVVTSSHNHTDHLDGETLGPLLQANPAMDLLVGEANREFASQRLAVSPERLTGLRLGEPLDRAGYTFQAIPAAHETLENDPQGHPRCIGLVVQAGPWIIYHSGDTLRYPGMETWLRRRPVDLALLPVNGRDPRRGVPGNLSGPEAVQLARDSGLGLVVPCHYEMFEFNSVSPQAFVQAAEQAGQPYRLLHSGERISLHEKKLN
ncbi:MAG TPA: MBL fold metallo-hydrolase [Anaerolineales bacterium]